MMQVSAVRLVPVAGGRGLLGYVSFLLDGHLRIDGVALRETDDGRLTLSFPSRRDRCGREHAYLRPIDNEAREAIERTVFAELGLIPGESP